jgi:hypothetical protein
MIRSDEKLRMRTQVRKATWLLLIVLLSAIFCWLLFVLRAGS